MAHVRWAAGFDNGMPERTFLDAADPVPWLRGWASPTGVSRLVGVTSHKRKPSCGSSVCSLRWPAWGGLGGLKIASLAESQLAITDPLQCSKQGFPSFPRRYIVGFLKLLTIPDPSPLELP